MPINVFGSTSGNTEIKIDTSSFVQKPFLRINCSESNMEEDIDMKNQLELIIYQTQLAYMGSIFKDVRW